jgi:hypothetical protein
MAMDKQSKEPIAPIDESEKVFVRASSQELEPGEIDRVAGGAGTCIIPQG